MREKILGLLICLGAMVFFVSCTIPNETVRTSNNTTKMPDINISEETTILEIDILEKLEGGKVACYLSPLIFSTIKPRIEACLDRNPNRLLYTLYPVVDEGDLSSENLEEFISYGLESVEDPEVKAFFMYYTPFADGLFTKIKESRQDILIIVTGRIDDEIPDSVDIMLSYDEVGMIKKQVKQAQNMGIETFFYISSDSVSIKGKNVDLENLKETILKEECKALGIEYIQRPPIQDAMGPEGEISSIVSKYGENISVFAPTSIYTDWLYHLPLKYKYIFVQQDDHCPVYTRLPYHLGIQSTSYIFPNDFTWLKKQLREKLSEQAQPGRYALLSAPFYVVSVTAAIEYGLEYSNGKTNGKVDIDVLRESFEKACGIHGFADANFELNEDEQYDNHFLFSTDYVVY